jgi:hypothetical protein
MVNEKTVTFVEILYDHQSGRKATECFSFRVNGQLLEVSPTWHLPDTLRLHTRVVIKASPMGAQKIASLAREFREIQFVSLI